MVTLTTWVKVSCLPQISFGGQTYSGSCVRPSNSTLIAHLMHFFQRSKTLSTPSTGLPALLTNGLFGNPLLAQPYAPRRSLTVVSSKVMPSRHRIQSKRGGMVVEDDVVEIDVDEVEMDAVVDKKRILDCDNIS